MQTVQPGGLDNADLAQLGSDDRVAVMRMVAEGELSVDEAVVRASRRCISQCQSLWQEGAA